MHKILANPFLSTSGKNIRQKEEHWQGFLIPQICDVGGFAIGHKRT
jgi:hypothetical protein